MALLDTALIAFNRGIVSKLGLARTDVKRVNMSAEIQENWIPRVLGSMMLRPGFGYTGGIFGDSPEKIIPHIFATDDCSLLEFTDSLMRVWINDVLLTRPAVTAAVTNGTFLTDVSGWTNSSDPNLRMEWAGANTADTGYGKGLLLAGDGINLGRATQTVVCNELGIEHALRVVITRGLVTFKVGSALGLDDFVSATVLETGVHSLSFTPTGNFTIDFQTAQPNDAIVDSCTIEAAGVVTLPTPYVASDLNLLRWDQSADIVYISSKGKQQRQVERRGTRPHARSWSIVLYRSANGPFLVENITPITLTPNSTHAGPHIYPHVSDPQLIASRALFRSGMVGSLFKLFITGQGYVFTPLLVGQSTAAVEVTGSGTNRNVRVFASGLTGSGATIALQQGTSNAGPWTTVTSYTSDQAGITFNDTFDGADFWYRLTLTVLGASAPLMEIGSLFGETETILRVTKFISSTVVVTEALTVLPYGPARGFNNDNANDATPNWQQGTWSDTLGWPNALSFYEGRLWSAGQNGVQGSESDAFNSFSDDTLGDSGPIQRTIGSGPVDTINWIVPLQRLLLGAQGSELSCRSTSFDEPLTPTNFNIKTASTQGSAAVPALKLDNTGIYVQRGGFRIYELAFDLNVYEYQSTQLTALCPELGNANGTAGVKIIRMALQRQPDTRILALRSDGVCMVGIRDKVEDVLCWITLKSDGASGLIEDVVVLPALAGNLDDQVYFVVNRTISGVTKRYLEKMALESEGRGGTTNKLADSFVVYSGPPITIITGLSNLEGQQVVVWADGVDVGTDASRNLIYTVTGGSITLAAAAANVCVGLPYNAMFKSAKLYEAINGVGSMLARQKNIRQLSALMADVHPKGLRFGPDFNNLDDLPEVYLGRNLAEEGSLDTIISEYTDQTWSFLQSWDVDTRLCMRADAPRPVTVIAAVMDYEMDTT